MSITSTHRHVFGGLAGRPRFIILREHLRAFPGVCTYCGAPTVRLHPEVPEGERGGHDQPEPDYSQLGGLIRFMGPHPCEACTLRGVIRGLFPPVDAPAVIGPAEAELSRLRTMLALASRELTPAPVTYEGAIFDPGRVYMTRAAATALGSCCSGEGPSNPAASEVRGHAHLPLFVTRHVRGDAGLLGSIADGDATKGAELGPLAGVLDRNAAAVASGRGVVRSVFPLTRSEPHRLGGALEVSVGSLHVRSVVEEPAVTLVCLSGEIDSD